MDIVMAVNNQGTIGKENRLMYRLEQDMQRFVQLTKGKQVIMGYRTFSEAGKLPNRLNIVIVDKTRPYKQVEGVVYVASYDEAIAYADKEKGLNETVVIGGSRVLEEALAKHQFTLHITEIDDNQEGDTYFHIPTGYERYPISTEKDRDKLTGKSYQTHYSQYKPKRKM